MTTPTGADARAAFAGLTPACRAVAGLIADGLTNEAIAASRDVELRTVEGQVKQIHAGFGLPPDHRSGRLNARVVIALTYLAAVGDLAPPDSTLPASERSAARRLARWVVELTDTVDVAVAVSEQGDRPSIVFILPGGAHGQIEQLRTDSGDSDEKRDREIAGETSYKAGSTDTTPERESGAPTNAPAEISAKQGVTRA